MFLVRFLLLLGLSNLSLISLMMLSSFKHRELTRRQYAFSPFMCDGSESMGEMRRKAYVSEDKHENRILVRAD